MKARSPKLSFELKVHPCPALFTERTPPMPLEIEEFPPEDLMEFDFICPQCENGYSEFISQEEFYAGRTRYIRVCPQCWALIKKIMQELMDAAEKV